MSTNQTNQVWLSVHNPNGQQTCLFALRKLKSLQLVNWWEIQTQSLFFMPLHPPALTSWIKMLRSDMVHSSTLGVGAMLLWGVLRAPHWVSGFLVNSTLLSPQSLAASLGHCSMFFHGLYHFSVWRNSLSFWRTWRHSLLPSSSGKVTWFL